MKMNAFKSQTHIHKHINTHDENKKNNVKCLFDAMKSIKVLSSALFSNKIFIIDFSSEENCEK
jgi:hypothetical protein